MTSAKIKAIKLRKKPFSAVGRSPESRTNIFISAKHSADNIIKSIPKFFLLIFKIFASVKIIAQQTLFCNCQKFGLAIFYKIMYNANMFLKGGKTYGR